MSGNNERVETKRIQLCKSCVYLDDTDWCEAYNEYMPFCAEECPAYAEDLLKEFINSVGSGDGEDEQNED